MAIAMPFSQQYSLSARFSQTLKSLFGKSEEASTPTQADVTEASDSDPVSNGDSLKLSSASQAKSTLSQVRTQSSSAEVNIKISSSVSEALEASGVTSSSSSRSASAASVFSSSAEAKLQRNVDLILRFLSKNGTEYNKLKSQFSSLYSKTSAVLSSDGSVATASSSQQTTLESLTELSQSGKAMTLAQMKALKSSSELSMKFQTSTSNENTISLSELGLSDPIVLDLSGEGINLTEAGNGAEFDINADGETDNTGWVSGNTALLCYDKNGNGVIDDGSELFGDQNGSSDGFAELAKYDSNDDGKIDISDPIYKKLQLYRDLNGDGKMSDDEFSTASELGIKSISLSCTEADEDVNGNSIVLRGSFEREDGTTGQMADVLFGYK